MCQMILPLLVLSFFGSVAAVGYKCVNPIAITPPEDLTQNVFWPSDWNDSQPPAPFDVNQQCRWQVTVPDGLYTTVVFYKNAPGASIYLQYPNVQTEELQDNDSNPYILTASGFEVNLFKTEISGGFSFKITWSKYPTPIPNPIPLKKGDTPVALAPNQFLNTFIAETNVSFLAFQLKNTSQNALLRQSAVYDGDSTSGKFLGNLYRLMQTNKAVISTGTKLSVYTWGLSDVFDYTLYMAQDHSNDQQLNTYQGVNCLSDTDCSVEMNARFGPAGLATVESRPEFLKNITQFPDGATFKVYEGVISDETLVTTLTQDNYKYRLPMELKNSMRQYVVSTGVLKLDLSRDANDADWNKMYDGRKGFVHSFNHGVMSNKQETDETFTTFNANLLFLNYVVRDADFTGAETTLTVTVSAGGQQISSTTYNSANVPPTTTSSIQGDTFEVKYQTHGAVTKGFRLDFSTTSAGYVTGSSTLGTSTSVATSTTTATTTPKTTPRTTPPTTSPTTSSISTASTPAPSSFSSSVSSSLAPTTGPIITNAPTSQVPPVTSTPKIDTTTKSSSAPSSLLIITGSLFYLFSLNQ